jgi:hypothetical protein
MANYKVSIQLTIETKSERHLLEYFATESTESTESTEEHGKHGKIKALEVIFPCSSVANGVLLLMTSPG